MMGFEHKLNLTMKVTPSNQPPLSKVLLYLLQGTGQATIDFVTFLHTARYWRSAYQRGGSAYVQELKRLRREAAARSTLQTLQRGGLVTIRRQNHRLIVALTHQGRTSALAYKLRHSLPNATNIFTVVIFDIPESAAPARQRLRLLLRQGGFTKLQQSVWGSQRNVYQLIADLLRQEKLTPWVNLFQATQFLNRPSVS